MSRLRSLLTPVISRPGGSAPTLPLTAALFGVVLVTSLPRRGLARWSRTRTRVCASPSAKASPFERIVEITGDASSPPESGRRREHRRQPAGAELPESVRRGPQPPRHRGDDALRGRRRPRVPGPAGTTGCDWNSRRPTESAWSRAACPRSATRSSRCRSGSASRRRRSSRWLFRSPPRTSVAGRRRALSRAGLRGRPRRRGSAQRAADDRRRGDRDLLPKTDADGPGSTTRASARSSATRTSAATSTASASAPSAYGEVADATVPCRCATPGATTSTRAASTRARSTGRIRRAQARRESGSSTPPAMLGLAYAPGFPRCSPTTGATGTRPPR